MTFNLKAFRRDLNLKQSDIQDILGITQGFVSKIENGRESFPADYIDVLTDKFGVELISKYVSRKTKDIAIREDQLVGVPYYENVDTACSIQGMYNDYEKHPPTFFINYPHFNDCTAYLPVVGDSMYPKYASGEIVAVKRIFNLDMIQWGEAYMVVGNQNTDDLRAIKLVHPHDDLSKLILRSSNPNFKGDTPINKADILEIYIVKGKITRSQL